MQEFEIRLEGLRFFAFHGVLPHEKEFGNEFLVDLEVRFPLQKQVEDNLKSTVNYANLFNIVKQEMQRSRDLLETVVYDIVEATRNNFPQITYVKCGITKIHPPIVDCMGKACVSFKWEG